MRFSEPGTHITSVSKIALGRAVREPCLNRRFSPEEQSPCTAIVLGKVSEVPQSIDAASRLVIPPLKEWVLFKELVDAHPGVRVIDLVGTLWRRVGDRHELSISLGGMWHSHPMGLGFGSVFLEFACADYSIGQAWSLTILPAGTVAAGISLRAFLWRRSYSSPIDAAVWAVTVPRSSVRRKLAEVLPRA